MQLRWVLSFIVAWLLAGCAAVSDGSVSDRDKAEPARYDYIVVGAGAGGGPLAARLAEAGRSVLLLEAGDNVFDTGSAAAQLTAQVPAFHPYASEHPELSWSYYVEHYDADHPDYERDLKTVYENADGVAYPCSNGRCEQPAGARRRGILYPRGTGVGGSTEVNALIGVSAKRSDWEHIESIAEAWGDDSWDELSSYDYFRGENHYFGRVQEWLSLERPSPDLALRDPKVLQLATDAIFDAGELITYPGASRNYTWAHAAIDLAKGDINKMLQNDVSGWRDADEGLYQFPLASQNGRRYGVRQRVLDAVARPGSTLTLETGAFVTRVLFDQSGATPKAIGVEYVRQSRVYGADTRASRTGAGDIEFVPALGGEVILAAGAFNTPQILMHSGVGPREHLEPLGIEVVADRPGVGLNLQDRYEVGVVSKRENPFAILAPCALPVQQADLSTVIPESPCLDEWNSGSGPLTTNGAIATLLIRSDRSQPEADLHVFGVPGVFRGYYPGYAGDGVGDGSYFTWVILKGHTGNTQTGTVRLRPREDGTVSPFDRPEINFRYFDGLRSPERERRDTANEDLQAAVNAVRMVRGLTGEGHETLADINRVLDEIGIDIETDEDGLLAAVNDELVEVWPGREFDTDEEIGQWVRDEAWGHHACGTAAIGRPDDTNAVLDSEFRVIGTENLRVVDASIFPRIPGTFIVLPIYMVSEKAADTILGLHE